MRSKLFLAAAAAAMAVGLAAPMPAKAFDFRDEPYRVGSNADPYSYQYHRPRYYPNVNSGYWRPAEEMRYAYRYSAKLPRYYQAWGWNSREWYIAHRLDRRADWHR